MNRLFQLLKTHFLAGVLIFLAVSVAIAHYVPGAWLLGWDSLVPEFNFSLNLKRAVFSAWQEYQGVGLAGGMGHGASLSRELVLWFLSPVIPAQFVRSFWTFAMLVIGPVGVYALFSTFFHARSQVLARQGAFLAGLFYLFNLATVQNFYTPFETFSSFYGFLPWLLWSGLRLLRARTKQTQLIYFGISLLATSAFQVQTLFIVYVLISSIFLIETWFRERKHALPKIGSWLGLTLAAHAFWLVPVAYFALFHGQVNVLAKQNQLSTPELRIMNRNFGDAADITALRGFWFEYIDSTAGKYGYLLQSWREYVSATHYGFVGQVLFVISIIGLLWAAHTHRAQKQYWWSWLVIAGLTMVALTAGAGSFGFTYAWLEQHVPLFSQIFRATFTKWSVVMALIVSMGLGAFLLQLSSILAKGKKLVLLVLGAAVLMLAPPFFQGKLVSENMQVQLPSEYEALFAFFRDKPRDARIVMLPIDRVWSWDFHTWGYRGSGFVWYGIEQPIVDRAFDIFSAENENFYHELTDAWQRKDSSMIEVILKNYQAGYALMDESVVDGNDKQVESTEDVRKILDGTGFSEVWHQGSLTVFENTEVVQQGFVTAPAEIQHVRLIDAFQARRKAAVLPASFITPAFNDSIHNIQTQIYPLAGITAEKLTDFRRSEDQGYISKEMYLEPGTEYGLVVPALEPDSIYTVPVEVSLQKAVLTASFARAVRIEVADQFLELPELGKYDLPLSNTFSGALFVVNGQSVALAQGETKNFSFQLRVDQPVRLSVNETLGKNTQGEFLIRTADQKNFVIPVDVWQPLLSEQRLAVIGNGMTHFQLRFPLFMIDLLPIFKELPRAENCDLFNRGEVLKLTEGASLVYAANNAGTSCESLQVSDVSPGASYVLFAAGENLAGRGPRIIFSGADKNFFYLEDLLDEKHFQQAYAILPQQFLESGYFVNLETKSFFREESKNRFDVLEAAELPLSYDLLSRITLIPTHAAPLKNSVELQSVQKWGTSFYLLHTEVFSDPGVVALSQGYNRGWLAIRTDGWPQILKHFQYNNWANAWEFPQGKNTVLLVYWPQLGVFAGYVVLIGTLILILKKRS